MLGYLLISWPLLERAQHPDGSTSTLRTFAPAAVGPVVCGWEGTPGWQRDLRVLPDGCSDLVYSDGVLRLVPAIHRAARHRVVPGGVNVGVRLRPGVLGILAGRPAGELAPGGSPVRELWGAQGRHLEDLLLRSPSPGDRRTLLERIVAERIEAAGGPDPAIMGAIELLAARSPDVPTIARSVACSERDLRRRFAWHVGHGPKRLHRILRFRSVLDRLRAGEDLATAAFACGFADQSHLTRDCVALSGSTPGRLSRPERPRPA